MDVDALKCIAFNLVKELKEMNWYGIDCNLENQEESIELSFVYLESLNTQCTLPHQFECEIKTFIKRKSSYCTFVDNSCQSTTTTTSQPFLLTEDGLILMTEDGQNYIV